MPYTKTELQSCHTFQIANDYLYTQQESLSFTKEVLYCSYCAHMHMNIDFYLPQSHQDLFVIASMIKLILFLHSIILSVVI